MTEKRLFPGRTTRCPVCNHEIRYSWLSGMSGSHLHFYANDSNDVLLRADWFAHIKGLMDQGVSDSTVLAEIDILLASLPPSSAKNYSVWSNVKCPKCNTEFPYRFKGNLKFRLEDTGVILIEGCVLDSDNGVYLVEIAST